MISGYKEEKLCQNFPDRKGQIATNVGRDSNWAPPKYEYEALLYAQLFHVMRYCPLHLQHTHYTAKCLQSRPFAPFQLRVQPTIPSYLSTIRQVARLVTSTGSGPTVMPLAM